MIHEVETSARPSLTIQPLDAANRAAWDAYVRRAPGGLPLHLSGWRGVMADTYGYETSYLCAAENGRVAGVLPLFAVPSRLTGKRAMTMPGGLCADSEAIASALLAHGRELARAQGLDKLVVQDSRQAWSSGQNSSEHVYWLVELQQTEEAQWSWLDGNIRRQVRKARDNGLSVEIDRSGALLDPFYDMFSRFTHQAGTPVFGRSFLENIVRTFPDGFNIALVRHEERPIAGYLQLEMNQTVYGMWGAALPDTLRLRPAYLALWEIMRDAVENGFEFLDMGRSPADSNASRFKCQWGGTAAPIFQIVFNDGNQTEPANVTDQVQSDQRFQLFMQWWPRLPLSVTRFIGPRLRRHIPFA
jgi:FemAB-related protein (PEP-CTERM system-associated)